MFLRWWSVALWLLVGVGWRAGSWAAGKQCSAVGALLAVDIYRNATGHWKATVRLDQESQLPAPPSRLLMDVRPITSRCKGVRTDSLLVTLQGPPPPPNPSYEEFPGIGYYKFHKEQVVFDEAKRICEAEDAQLLILNSEEEASAIKQLVQRHLKNFAWITIGFHDRNKEGEYVTIYEKPLATTGFTRWSPGQPDNGGGNENCGSINSDNIGLNDYPCGAKTVFICEQIVI